MDSHPPGLTIVTSDRPRTLMDRLAADIGAVPLPPLEDEIIVIQSQGMSRWVRLELARKHGCAASLDVPFPAKFCQQILASRARRGATTPSATEVVDPRFEREPLTWRIFEELAGAITDELSQSAAPADAPPKPSRSGSKATPAPGRGRRSQSPSVFAPLARFLQDRDARKTHGLAARIADRFDDYRLYRPDILLAWERGDLPLGETEHAPWQAELWRRLCAGESPMHFARAFTLLLDDLRRPDTTGEGLPSRVSVFGVSSLPPLFIELLRAMGRFVPVRVYASAPPRSTWAVGAPGHPLFSAFGRQSREFLELLGRGAVTWEEYHTAAGPTRAGCLTTLQADVRAGLVPREYETFDRVPLEAEDASLRVHICHSPMREMEVLRDQLLYALARDRTLRPHDILVLVPDISVYAPFIEAVFGVGEKGLPSIPFHIADRSFASENPIADAVLRLLRLVDSRLTAPEVLALLDVPSVRHAAGLGDHAPEVIQQWVSDTRIRWGYDGVDRAERFGVPEFEENSWRAGLDRLLMGYATGPLQDPVADVVPHTGDLPGDADTLGNFAAWLDRLYSLLRDWKTERPPDDWRASLTDAVARFFGEPEGSGDEEVRTALTAVRRRIAGLGEARELAGFAGAVDHAVVRDWLEHALADDSVGSGFLVGGATFCALKPMRSIPFRVIAVAGINNESFPRRNRRLAFDLLEIEPRPGDRDFRADDRQLFLDTLLAAEEQLVLSYVGRSITDNKPRASSVVIAELLDHLDARFRVDGKSLAWKDETSVPARDGRRSAKTGSSRDADGPRARELIEIEHRLQPFSQSYFVRGNHADPRLFSYSRVHAATLAAGSAERTDVKPFIPEDLSGDKARPAESARKASLAARKREIQGAGRTAKSVARIELEELIECWQNPARYYCERVLQLKLRREDEPVDMETEPLTVDALARYGIDQEMLATHLAGTREPARELERLAARGELPPGALADAWHSRLSQQMSGMLTTLPSNTPIVTRAVTVPGDGWEISGQLDWLTPHGRMQVRAARVKPKDLLHAWLMHLVMNATQPRDGSLPASRVIGTDCAYAFRPVEDAKGILSTLVTGYQYALLAPLPVFEKASHAYSEQKHKLRSPHSRARTDPLDCARARFETSDASWSNETSDDADPYVALCWRGRDPLALARRGRNPLRPKPRVHPDFDLWSEALWRPAFEHREELES